MAYDLRFGIMGGTFDPIHYGHLAAAEEAKHRFALQKVIFIPCGQPPHKKDYQVTNAEHRLEMTRLAIEDNPEFEISRLEIDRPGPSYAIDTIAELRQSYLDAEFYFITGADAILEILTWKQPQRLADMCELIAVSRPGYDLAVFKEKIGNEIAPRVHLLDVPGVSISSTEIRCRVSQGTPVRYLLPEKVRTYIEKESLYR
jgi:nicotinate-nucleotide adenylyltransferase